MPPGLRAETGEIRTKKIPGLGAGEIEKRTGPMIS